MHTNNDTHDLLHALRNLTLKMLNEAKQENWEQLEADQLARDALLLTLSEIDIDESLASEARTILEQVKAIDQQLKALARENQQETQNNLMKTYTHKKAMRGYQNLP